MSRLAEGGLIDDAEADRLEDELIERLLASEQPYSSGD
jgi:hypothetical protein